MRSVYTSARWMATPSVTGCSMRLTGPSRPVTRSRPTFTTERSLRKALANIRCRCAYRTLFVIASGLVNASMPHCIMIWSSLWPTSPSPRSSLTSRPLDAFTTAVAGSRPAARIASGARYVRESVKFRSMPTRSGPTSRPQSFAETDRIESPAPPFLPASYARPMEDTKEPRNDCEATSYSSRSRIMAALTATSRSPATLPRSTAAKSTRLASGATSST